MFHTNFRLATTLQVQPVTTSPCGCPIFLCRARGRPRRTRWTSGPLGWFINRPWTCGEGASLSNERAPVDFKKNNEWLRCNRDRKWITYWYWHNYFATYAASVHIGTVMYLDPISWVRHCWVITRHAHVTMDKDLNTRLRCSHFDSVSHGTCEISYVLEGKQKCYLTVTLLHPF